MLTITKVANDFLLLKSCNSSTSVLNMKSIVMKEFTKMVVSLKISILFVKESL